MKRILSAIMALSLVAVLAGCGSSGSGGGGGGETVVNMQNVQFSPKTVEVKAGTTVKWVNKDQVDHSVNEGDGEKKNPDFASPDIRTGDSWTHTFTEKGTYDVACKTGGHHLLGMKMKVIVN